MKPFPQMEHFFRKPRNFTPAMHFSCTFSSSFYISAMKVISGAEIRMSLPKFLRFRLVDGTLPDAGGEISFLLFNLACLLACPLQEGEEGGGRGRGYTAKCHFSPPREFLFPE
jgi:hypothetical protein